MVVDKTLRLRVQHAARNTAHGKHIDEETIKRVCVLCYGLEELLLETIVSK